MVAFHARLAPPSAAPGSVSQMYAENAPFARCIRSFSFRTICSNPHLQITAVLSCQQAEAGVNVRLERINAKMSKRGVNVRFAFCKQSCTSWVCLQQHFGLAPAVSGHGYFNLQHVV